MNITTRFTSTQRHGAFVALFSVAIVTEVILFLIVGVVYINMQIKYNNALEANRIRVTKLMAIKDSEYEEILGEDKDRLRGDARPRGINSSIVDDEDKDDQW